jgi:hypothetical protein
MDALFIFFVIGLLIILAGFIALVIYKDKRALTKAFRNLSADQVKRRKQFMILYGRKERKGGGNGN